MAKPFADLVERDALLGKARSESMPKLVPTHTATSIESNLVRSETAADSS